MSRRVISIWLILIMVFSLVVVVDVITDFTPTVRGTTLYVNTTGTGGAYPKIQYAIDNASDGYTVFVYNGTYYENVVVNKTINLTGENKDTTIIDGRGSGDLIYISANCVNITGFTLTNGTNGIYLSHSDYNNITGNNINSSNDVCICLDYSSNNNVTDNNVSNAWKGIYVQSSSGNTIANNNVSNNYGGIYFQVSSNNNITDNNISSNNFIGIDFFWSTNNNIAGNNISNNRKYGLEFENSPENIVKNNTLLGNGWFGFYFDGGSLNTKFINNTVNGDRHYHYYGLEGDTTILMKNITVEVGNISNFGNIFLGASKNITFENITVSNSRSSGIYLYECENVTINNISAKNNTDDIRLSYSHRNRLTNIRSISNTNNSIHLFHSNYNNITGNNIYSNNGDGIYLDCSSNNNITGNNVSNANYGIYAVTSSGNTISNNNVVSNNDKGIYITFSSNNIITDNNISSNILYGLYFFLSSNNNIIGNQLSLNNWHGINLKQSNNNLIYLNNFINNGENGYSDSINIWKSPHPLRFTHNDSESSNYVGNYWNDYIGSDEDGDGIGDTPYNITSESDHYPLIEPFEAYRSAPSETEVVMNETTSNTSILFETVISHIATLNTSVTGDLNGTFNLTHLEIILINSSSFAGKGFSKGNWSAIIEGISYEGNLKGMLFKKPGERKIHLNGIISGDLKGIIEGCFTESVNESDIYDLFNANLTINNFGNDLVFATLGLNGTVNYSESVDYISELYVLQTHIEGVASGHYNGSLSIVLTHVRINNETNPYYGEGFSIISYISEFGSGEGWSYDKIISPNSFELNGFFTYPLWGIASGTLNGSILPRRLSISIERMDLGLPPKADLKVMIWGPERVSPGQTVDYIIEYRNDGLKTAEDVEVVMKLPITMEYLSNTGGALFNRESNEVVWHFDNIPPKYRDYISASGTIVWGLLGGTFIDPIVSIPKNKTQIQIDANVNIIYETLEETESFVKMRGNISNSSESGNFYLEFYLTEVYEEIEPVLNVTDTLDGVEFNWSFTFEGNSVDLVEVSLEMNNMAIEISEKWQEVKDAKKAQDEHKVFLDWLRNEDLISQETYGNYVNWNNFRSKIPVIRWLIGKIPKFGTVEKYFPKGTPFGSIYANAVLWNEIKVNLQDKKIKGEIPIDVDSLDKLYMFYKSNESYGVSSTRSIITVAYDPNIKYGSEGYVFPGEELNYSIEYENEGEGIAFGVYFTDTLNINLDDSTLKIDPVISTIDGSEIAPAGTYNPITRTVTWFIGEVGPGEGGYANISVKVKSDTPKWTEIINFAIVYFPSVPETTRTNCIVSIVILNQSPIADAGIDLIISQGDIVGFNGSASTDNVGIVNYTWNLTYDSDEIYLFGINPQFTFDIPGVYVITLNVCDGTGNWDTDTMTITVRDILLPISDAGPDQTVDQDESVTFNGSGSTDNIDIVNFNWSFEYNGTVIVLYGENPEFTFEIPGIYNVMLNVTDAAGNWDTDTIAVTVIDTEPPIANAGENQGIDQGNIVIFDGSDSTDNVDIVNYIWLLEHNSTEVVLYGQDPEFTFEIPGIYNVLLNITDANGNWDTDTIVVTVMDIEPPITNAGKNQLLDQGNTTIFNGSGSTDNVGIVNYTWSFEYNGTEVVLHGENPEFTFEIPGIFNVTLNVTDAAGNWNIDTKILTVLDVVLPIANAGQSQTIQQGNITVFDASASRDNIGIVNYTWTFEYNNTVITLYGMKPKFTFEIVGVYNISLKVTDASGNWATDTLVVTVFKTEQVEERGKIGDGTIYIILLVVIVIVLLIIGAIIVRSRREILIDMTEEGEESPDETDLLEKEADEDLEPIAKEGIEKERMGDKKYSIEDLRISSRKEILRIARKIGIKTVLPISQVISSILESQEDLSEENEDYYSEEELNEMEEIDILRIARRREKRVVKTKDMLIEEILTKQEEINL